jgi:hypothetical protein
MTLGLLISAMANSSDKTMPLLVVVVMFQVILTGGIFPLAGKPGIDQVAWVSPSRWGFAAIASTVNLNVIQQPPHQAGAPATRAGGTSDRAGGSTGRAGTDKRAAGGTAAAGRPAAVGTAGAALPTDPLWDHKPTTWLTDIGLMGVLGLLFSLLAWRRIIRIKPGRRR